MAFLCIPQILLQQGAGEMRTRVHIYKQFLLSNQRRAEQVINHTRTKLVKHPSSTQEVTDHWRRLGKPDCHRFSMTEDQSGPLHGILGTLVLYAACDKRMLFSLASFDLMPRTNCVFLIPSFCAAFPPPTLQQPGSHSKTAGVQVSDLINTQIYFPPLNTFHSFETYTHRRKKEREKRQFPMITLLKILWLCGQAILTARETSSK